MTLEEFENCLKTGEGIRTEFKASSVSCPSDLRSGLFEKVRKIIRSAQPGHRWLSMNDREYAVSSGIHQQLFDRADYL